MIIRPHISLFLNVKVKVESVLVQMNKANIRVLCVNTLRLFRLRF